MTIEIAKQGIRELINEGYGFNATRIYINDLARGRDVTKEEAWELLVYLTNLVDDSSFITF